MIRKRSDVSDAVSDASEIRGEELETMQAKDLPRIVDTVNTRYKENKWAAGYGGCLGLVAGAIAGAYLGTRLFPGAEYVLGIGGAVGIGYVSSRIVNRLFPEDRKHVQAPE